MLSKEAAPKTLNTRLLPQLEKEYEFTILWLQSAPTGTLLYTDLGLYEVRATSASAEQLRFSAQAGMDLEANGYYQLLSLQIPKSGEWNLSSGSQLLAVTRACNGRDANLLHAEEREKSMVCLANFHQFTKGILHRVAKRERTDFPDWRKQLQTGIEKLRLVSCEAELRNFPFSNELWEGAMLAYHGFFTPVYERAANLEQKRSGLTHGALHSGCFRMEDTCYLQLPDHFALRNDFRVYDLVCCFSGVMRQTQWDPEIGYALLEAYESITPLQADEKKLMGYWLHFPWNYLSAFDTVRSDSKNLPESLRYRLQQECLLAKYRIQFAGSLLE